ncbi:dihydrofolate reductase family protein [Pseudonocardia sp. KRD-184]|uniref:Dihydrofolate reductase family protein n=1 Tax=Pseudonocardia oceani TaxID=2792013 RepID=A0ABS6U7N4_9PSEU|nr:dihydrofolate reductase family protein [Pseudonocardia oceani]MBW0088641.1 dihydrofolate reductase family protein [Pseudonocardia oceani]MBW0095539.1 dihydrofolate reductase family protein [Pseudonocardia oceani]MBW0111510.1 dihydrofolate reductase family protein [Pseudonocardia oceani]MBW0121550.1 dihydrofolate reductase family protein [Pseudonocardia oceani]MBW0128251.1 dihydrofolate reductase family protein [Pseudonocardia oceani]
MSIVSSHLAVSLDGYVAGPDQSPEDPLGRGGERLHEWMFVPDGPESDARIVEESLTGVGAFVMGRNMFGPDRGPWDPSWTGWWGEDPPFHAPVFVLAHRAREPLEMAGGTTFHFVTDGIRAALDWAREAAGERLFDGLDGLVLEQEEVVVSPAVTHLRYRVTT